MFPLHCPTTRRRFLGTASVTIAGIASSSTSVAANDGLDAAEKLAMGVEPDASCMGMVVVPGKRLTFLTFYGIDQTNPKNVGTVVVSLKGCADFRFLAEDNTLDPCCVYEVPRSKWVSAATTGRRRVAAGLNHYVFTFLGVQAGLSTGASHFECLAQSYKCDFFGEVPFGDVVDSLRFGDALSR